MINYKKFKIMYEFNLNLIQYFLLKTLHKYKNLHIILKLYQFSYLFFNRLVICRIRLVMNIFICASFSLGLIMRLLGLD